VKREADKRHSRLWVGTVANVMIELGNVLQASSTVTSITVTVEKVSKLDRKGMMGMVPLFPYRIDIKRKP
jgi:hypothetical protein